MDIKQLSQSEPIPPTPPTRRPGFVSRIDVLQSLKLHTWTAVLVTLFTLVVGAAWLMRHRSVYEATSVVYVSPTFPASAVGNREQEYHYESYVEEQSRTMTRYDVLADALRKLQPGVWSRPGESEESAVERLENSLVVKRDGLTYQVGITLTGSHPEHLAEIVNDVTDSFLRKTKGEEFYGREERLNSLRQARAQTQADLNDKLHEQAMINQTLGVAVVGDDNSDQFDTQVARLQTDLTAAHEQRIQAEAQLNALTHGTGSTPNAALSAAADEIILTDPGLLALKASLSQKRAVLLDQLTGMTPSNPLRKATEDQLAQIEKSLQQMQNTLRGQASARLEQKSRMELNRAQTVESQLLADLQAYTHQATTAGPSFQRAGVLKGDIAALQARYTALDDQTRTLELDSNTPGSVHISSPARTPTGPLPSKTKTFGPLLLPIAILLGIVAVVLMDLFDPRLYTGSDVEYVLGISPLGAIFDDRDVSMQIFDESILRLAAGIDQAARTSGVRTVVLTAVHAGAGTTTLVENLGSTLAKLGRKTLTIDASGVTAPVAYVTLSFNRAAQSAGALSKVKSEIQSTAVVAQSFVPKLTPLTSFMDQAFKDLTNEYDIVLVDATPIPISAETEYLARFADVTVLVAEAGETTKAQLLRAAGRLEHLQIAGMASIINKVGLRRVSQAVRNDLRAFEERSNKESMAWKPSWNDAPVPVTAPATPVEADFDHQEEPVAVRENSSYA